jgi:NADH-quinone oxidoreductase subunit D
MTGDAKHIGAKSLSDSLGFPETVVEVGMTHPGVRHAMTAVGGTTSFLVQLDDDRITDLEVEIGLGHRGFEKEVESTSFDHALPYVSRLGHAGGVIAETAYCLAVEALIGVALPDRAIWLRTLVNEIARVTDHFARLGAVMSAIGLLDAELAAQRAELEAARLLAFAVGRGPLAGWLRIGGVASALPEGFPERWSAGRVRLLEMLARFETIAVGNPTCQRRLRDVASMSVDDCLAWGVTGPSLRASGCPMDIRRDRPYLAYGALDFDVPIGESGDDLDRMLVVLEEIRQSLGMIEQCHKLLSSLGPGVVAVEGAETAGASRLPGWEVPAGESVATVESSTGELGFLIVSDGRGSPRRIRCRPPSFFHAQAMPQMLRGARLDDLLPTAALLHLVSAECDR